MKIVKIYKIYREKGLKGIFSSGIRYIGRFFKSPFLSDIKLTQYVRNKIKEIKAEEGVKSINDLIVSNYKTSDKIFILGCGSSVNERTLTDWKHVGEHDSIGFNFWLMHDFTPTYYFIEPEPCDQRNNLFLSILREKQDKYACVPFICEFKRWNLSNRPFDALPEKIRKNWYIYSPFYLRTRSRFVARILLMVLKWLRSNKIDSDFRYMVHHRATLSAAIMFSVLAGYKEIVLIGVDLNNSIYFWEDPLISHSYDELPINIQSGNVHDTVNPSLNHQEKALPVDVYLNLLDKTVLKKMGVHIHVWNKTSRLYPRFPLYFYPSIK